MRAGCVFMKRCMLQAYVTGVTGSDKAAEHYQKAFDASLVSSYLNEDGTYYHAELDVYGQILALSEAGIGEGKLVTGATMQFCLQFGEGEEALLRKAYGVLKENADIRHALGACDFSPLMADLIDQFGVRWCLFV